MNKYENLTFEVEKDILEDIIDDLGVSNILSIGNVYSILREHFNNEILEEYERRNPEIFETYENFYRCCDEEWSEEECDSFHNDHCPVCDKEVSPYMSIGELTGKEFEHYL